VKENIFIRFSSNVMARIPGREIEVEAHFCEKARGPTLGSCDGRDAKHSFEEFNSGCSRHRHDGHERCWRLRPLSVILSSFTFCHLYPLAFYVSRTADCSRSIRECNFRAVEESSPMELGTSDTDTIQPIKLRGYIRRWLSNFGAYVATLLRTLFSSFS